MDKITGYCGLVCTNCPAYVATQANDQAALKQVAEQWAKEFDAPNMTVENVTCDGCLADTGPKCVHCSECKIRACGVERGVVNCAHCTEYACEKLENFFGFAPDARTVLDNIRQSL